MKNKVTFSEELNKMKRWRIFFTLSLTFFSICFLFLNVKNLYLRHYSCRGSNIHNSVWNTHLKHDENMARFPDALLIGEMKCGTTALQTFLNLHPNISFAEGEINFFGLNYKKGFDWYRKRMPIATKDQLIMERSVYFCGTWGSFKNIYQFNPDIKLILILRDPIKRTISHFSMSKRQTEKFKNLTFEKYFFNGKSKKILTSNDFIRRSLYYRSMLSWIHYFALNQIHIVDGEKFITNPIKELLKIEMFLNIPNFFNRKVLYFDEDKQFYCFIKNNRKECLPDTKGSKHVSVNEDTMNILLEFFRPHNEKFFELIGRTFEWK